MGVVRGLVKEGAREFLRTMEPIATHSSNIYSTKDTLGVDNGGDWQKPDEATMRESQQLFRELFAVDPVGETEILIVAFSSLGAAVEHSSIVKDHLSGKKVMNDQELGLFKRKFTSGGWDDDVHGKT